MIDNEHVKNGVMNYANQSVIPMLPLSKQFFAGFAIGVMREKMENIMRSAEENAMIRMLDIVHDGQTDIETLYGAAKAQIHRVGSFDVDIPMIGKLTFRENDLDELYQAIMRG